MKLDRKEIMKTAKHAALMGARTAGLYFTYTMMMTDENSPVTRAAGYTLAAEQTRGLYNQFRHAVHHATGAIQENETAQWLNQLSHEYLPHVPGIKELATQACRKLKMG